MAAAESATVWDDDVDAAGDIGDEDAAPQSAPAAPWPRKPPGPDDGDHDPRALPASIHSARMEYTGLAGLRGDTLGSFAWSREFERYIRGALPASVRQEREAWHQWWTIPYVVERVRAAGARGDLPPRMVEAVLLLHNPPEEWRELAAQEPLAWYAEVLHRVKRGPDWLRNAEHCVLRYVRRRLLPYDRPPRRPRSAAAPSAPSAEPPEPPPPPDAPQQGQ